MVKAARLLIGATDPLEAAPGTIRGDLAVEKGRNVVHGSDSAENGVRETGALACSRARAGRVWVWLWTFLQAAMLHAGILMVFPSLALSAWCGPSQGGAALHCGAAPTLGAAMCARPWLSGGSRRVAAYSERRRYVHCSRGCIAFFSISSAAAAPPGCRAVVRQGCPGVLVAHHCALAHREELG